MTTPKAKPSSAAILRLLNDIADSPHRLRHAAGFSELVAHHGFVVKEMMHGQVHVCDPVADAAAAKAEARAAAERAAIAEQAAAPKE